MPVVNFNPGAEAPKQDTQILRETEIRDAIGINSATPPTNSLQARVQALINAIGSGASPASDTLQSRLGGLSWTLGNPNDVSATSDSANVGILPLIKRGLGILTNIKDFSWMSIPVSTYSSLAQVSVGTAAVQLVASNGNRKQMIIYNSGLSTILINFGGTASASSYSIPLPAGFAYFDDSPYQGAVSGICQSGSSTAQVTSLLA
ncbi:MAG: hypothetical protein U7123_07285 [Potamolinea sp.]